MRHRTDWLSLLAGLLFVGVGIRFVIAPVPDVMVMAPIVIFGLGLAGFVGVLSKAFRKR
ncbi:hypothetical protein ABZU32_21410 [Sphaerisporangium sp. NPDC005288]|uniref:XapX domain-containing protein n=1 Tax=Sphaerisporangium rhizosphaerae TaxID=2269375 RepID=A0ABW2NYV7_9ACTN